MEKKSSLLSLSFRIFMVMVILTVSIFGGACKGVEYTMKTRSFGVNSRGEEVTLYTLTGKDIEVDIMDQGGTIVAIRTPDKDGNTVDVCLGYDDVTGYEANGGYIGALIGRVGNRIGGGKFTLNGVDYQLNLNDGANHLHGGYSGFDKKLWDAKVEGNKLILTTFSADGEENYPGNMTIKVVYYIVGNELFIEYNAESDADTLCNLTNHCYFNLEGNNAPDVYDQLLYIDADNITPVDNGLIPHGEFMSVEGTPFNFKVAKPIGQDINANNEQLKICGGYDHNFCINTNGEFKVFATAYSEKTGVEMVCKTDLPGVQFYSGNFLNNVSGKNGAIYNKRAAFCLETQVYPNAINCPEYPSYVLKKGEKYYTKTSYTFNVKG